MGAGGPGGAALRGAEGGDLPALGELRRLGYRVEWRELRACDYGAPTIRKRLFLIVRRDGEPIVWPAATHAEGGSGGLKPWRTAAEIIDWSIPCPSIFERSRPLKEATCRRIVRGIQKFVIGAGEPFLVSIAHGDSGGRREYGMAEPLGAVTSGGISHAVVAPTLLVNTTGHPGDALEAPLHTVSTGGIMPWCRRP